MRALVIYGVRAGGACAGAAVAARRGILGIIGVVGCRRIVVFGVNPYAAQTLALFGQFARHVGAYGIHYHIDVL